MPALFHVLAKMDALSAVDEVKAMLAKMPPDERKKVAALMAKECSEGSQPIQPMETDGQASDGAHPRIAHASAAEKTWVYDGHDEQATLDKTWVEGLNDNESNFPGEKTVYKFASEKKCGGKSNSK